MAARDVEAGRAHVLLSIRDKLSQGLKLAERRLQTFGTYVATTAGTIAAGGAGALAWPLKLSADMEQAAVSFEVFLGSAEKAKALIAEVETMAARTPFQFDELRDTTQMLLQFGVPLEDVLQQVRNLGDVSGGNSEKLGRLALAFGQVMAKGRLMGQEVMQMTENGFNPLQEISRTTGRSMKDLMAAMERGEISSMMLANAFATAAGTGGRFNRMMDKQSSTLTGLVSTLMDYSKMALRAFGDTLVPLFKDVMKVGISAAQGVSAFVLANQALVAGVAKVILIVSAVAGAFLALGVASLGLSFVVGIIASGFGMISSIAGTVVSVVTGIGGLIGSAVAGIVGALSMIGPAIVGTAMFLLGVPGMIAAAWSGMIAFFVGVPAMISAALATIFSPIGIMVGLVVVGLVAAGVVAYQFRDAIMSTFSSAIAAGRSFVSGLIQPLINGFHQVLGIFRSTFGAIQAAFLDGQLVTAANIAWLGVQAAAWQAAASIGQSITYVLDALSTWVPGFGAVRDYIGSVIGSIGQAILSGQWELAAAIAMAKVQLAVLIPWNYIAATFSHVTTGMMIAWDHFSYAIGEAFTRGSDIIVDGINWLYDKFLWLQKAWANLTGDMELAVSTTKAQKDMEDYKKILQDTREGQRNARAAGLEKSVNDRSAANQSAAAARGKQETDLQDKIKSLEKDAAAAAGVAGSGGGTLQGNANVAKAKLDAATRAAEAERKAREAQGAEVAKLGSSGIKPLGGSDGKIAGSFSAAAAVALGSGGNNTAQKQLTYTQRIAALMEENNRKKGAVFT